MKARQGRLSNHRALHVCHSWHTRSLRFKIVAVPGKGNGPTSPEMWRNRICICPELSPIRPDDAIPAQGNPAAGRLEHLQVY